MSGFKVVDNINNIELSSEWIDSVKFDSKGRTVEENGKPITESYQGKQYRLISKQEREFTTWERVGRGFLGVLAVVCTLGIAIFAKPVRKLFIQDKAKIRFGVIVPQSSSSQKPKSGKSDSEYSISEKELQSGVVISEETISKIQTCMKNVLQCKEEGGGKLYNSQGNHRVFSLDTAPEYIFKMKASKNVRTLGRDDSMKARYQTMINAQTVCRTHALGLLVIPNAKLFTVEANGEEYEIIAEKKLDLNPNESAQEQNFEEYASSLTETIRQLAVFICKTGYSDVEWRNNPVLNDAPDQFGCRKIGLIDIEEMDSKTTGLFGGGFGRRGLVRCVNQDQGRIVEKVAKKYGVSTSSFASAYARRKKEIEKNKKLKEYYAAHNITTGYEPLEVDVNSLSLDLKETGDVRFRVGKSEFETKTVTKRDIAEKLVEKINFLILKNEASSSLKGKRRVIVDIHSDHFMKYNELGLPPGKFFISEEDEKKRWLPQIIHALVEKGHLFELEKVNGHGYFIQA